MGQLILADFELDLSTLLARLDAKLDEGLALVRYLRTQAQPTFANLILPLSNFNAELSEFWSPVAHLNNVADNEDLRVVYEQGALKLRNFSVTVGQDQALYQAYLTLQQGAEFAQLSVTQQKLINDAIIDFQRSGVGLSASAREIFKRYEQELVLATTKFEHNLIDAVKAWHYDTLKLEEFSGVPETVLVQAKKKAKQAGVAGYRFGIDAPTYLTVVGYAEQASMRELFYRAYVTRASSLANEQFDNSQSMLDIVNLRARQATLLGYPHYADYALVKRMAKRPQVVLEFLYDLAQRARPKALEDWQELQEFAQQVGGPSSLQAWDIAYFSERLKQQKLGFTEEALRPYFPLAQVWQGLLALVSTLFGIHFKERPIKAWDPQVQFLEVYDAAGLVGGIYVDLYARDHKRAGAWMDECKALRVLQDGQVQRPLAFLNANFLPPREGEPAYLTHDEVLTLFHELGHVLQHVLTKISLHEVGGIQGIPWDAVELPSQFMENFCYEPEILKKLTRHQETGQPLEDHLIQALRASRTFQSGLMMLRQIEFALFDMQLYLQGMLTDVAQIQALLDRVRQEVAVIIPPEFNRFQYGFSHIFSGGYAAGYYSYKWAELLSSDAFSRFEEEGILNPRVGEDFRNTILAQGGSRDAADIFVDFRGRAPKIDALLKHSGIAP